MSEMFSEKAEKVTFQFHITNHLHLQYNFTHRKNPGLRIQLTTHQRLATVLTTAPLTQSVAGASTGMHSAEVVNVGLAHGNCSRPLIISLDHTQQRQRPKSDVAHPELCAADGATQHLVHAGDIVFGRPPDAVFIANDEINRWCHRSCILAAQRCDSGSSGVIALTSRRLGTILPLKQGLF